MINVPVLVGAVPLLAVSKFTIEEGYKTAAIPESRFVQLVTPTAKTITIEALLIDGLRALRPALEAMALTSRFLASVTAPLMAFTGVPVVSLHQGIHIDMQITALTFTQSSEQHNAIAVVVKLVHVPRTSLGAIIGGALDVAAGVGTAFL